MGSVLFAQQHQQIYKFSRLPQLGHAMKQFFHWLLCGYACPLSRIWILQHAFSLLLLQLPPWSPDYINQTSAAKNIMFLQNPTNCSQQFLKNIQVVEFANNTKSSQTSMFLFHPLPLEANLYKNDSWQWTARFPRIHPKWKQTTHETWVASATFCDDVSTWTKPP